MGSSPRRQVPKVSKSVIRPGCRVGLTDGDAVGRGCVAVTDGVRVGEGVCVGDGVEEDSITIAPAPPGLLVGLVVGVAVGDRVGVAVSAGTRVAADGMADGAEGVASANSVGVGAGVGLPKSR